MKRFEIRLEATAPPTFQIFSIASTQQHWHLQICKSNWIKNLKGILMFITGRWSCHQKNSTPLVESKMSISQTFPCVFLGSFLPCAAMEVTGGAPITLELRCKPGIFPNFLIPIFSRKASAIFSSQRKTQCLEGSWFIIQRNSMLRVHAPVLGGWISNKLCIHGTCMN